MADRRSPVQVRYPPLMKRCAKCKTDKPVTQFNRSRRSRDGRQAYCKTCNRENRTQHYRDNPDLRKNNDLWSKYRLRPDDVERMLTEQDNKCPLCERSFDVVEWCVDHDHKTGAVRGLLCASCNKSLGWFENKFTAVQTYLGALTQSG